MKNTSLEELQRKYNDLLEHNRLLNYGEVIVDRQFIDSRDNARRLRVILFEDNLYFTQMCNGEVVEIIELPKTSNEQEYAYVVRKETENLT